MKHMFKLHDELYACLDDMERQAQHQLEIEKHYEEQQWRNSNLKLSN